MGSPSRGAVSGVIAGSAYGVVFAVIGYFTLASMKAIIISELTNNAPSNSTLTPDQLFNSALLIGPVLAVVVGAGGGVVLGAIYGWIFEKIPGRGPISKGLVFGVIYWSLFSLVGGLGNLQYGIGYYGAETATGLVTALLFGWLLGHFYGRLMAHEGQTVSIANLYPEPDLA